MMGDMMKDDKILSDVIKTHKRDQHQLLSELKSAKIQIKELKKEQNKVHIKSINVENSASTVKKNVKMMNEKVTDSTIQLEARQKQNKRFTENIKDWTNRTLKENQNMMSWVLNWGKQVSQLKNQIEDWSYQYSKNKMNNKIRLMKDEESKMKTQVCMLRLQKENEDKKKLNLLNRIREGGCNQFLRSSEAKQAINFTENFSSQLKQKNLYKEQDLAREIKDLQDWMKKNYSK